MSVIECESCVGDLHGSGVLKIVLSPVQLEGKVLELEAQLRQAHMHGPLQTLVEGTDVGSLSLVHLELTNTTTKPHCTYVTQEHIRTGD